MKTIAICGSFKFIKEMKALAEILFLEGNCVLLPVFPEADRSYTEEEKLRLADAHRERIRRADGIYVVNVGGYIGTATKSEIELAAVLGKEIHYHQRPDGELPPVAAHGGWETTRSRWN